MSIVYFTNATSDSEFSDNNSESNDSTQSPSDDIGNGNSDDETHIPEDDANSRGKLNGYVLFIYLK